MRAGHKEVFLSVALITAVIAAAWMFSRASRHSLKHLIGEQAPDIEYPGSEAGTSQRLSQKRGRVILLNFWASWCTPCLEEMPSLKMLENHFSEKGFLLLAFNLGESPNVKAKLSETSYPRNLIFQVRAENLRPYESESLPLSVLIDRDGRVRKIYEGGRDWADIEYIREIEELLR
jgi:thiol-disulfide isomerase/thioredoxin